MKRRDASYVPKAPTYVRIVGMPRDDGEPIHEARSRMWSFVRGFAVGLCAIVAIAWALALAVPS